MVRSLTLDLSRIHYPPIHSEQQRCFQDHRNFVLSKELLRLCVVLVCSLMGKKGFFSSSLNKNCGYLKKSSFFIRGSQLLSL